MDELQHRKNTSGLIPVNQVQESEATMSTGTLKLDRLEKLPNPSVHLCSLNQYHTSEYLLVCVLPD